MEQERMQASWLDPNKTFDIKEGVRIMQKLAEIEQFDMFNAQLRPIEGVLIADFSYEASEQVSLTKLVGKVFEDFGYKESAEMFLSFEPVPVEDTTILDKFNALALNDSDDWEK